MKKQIFALFAILSLVSGYAYAYDADGNANTKREIAGAPAYSAYREYQLVRFANRGENVPSLSAGDVVAADCVSDDGVTVAIPGTTNSADAVRGVVVSATIPTCDVAGTTAQTDFGRRNWGYVQVKGLCTKINMDTTDIAAGASFRCATTTKYATSMSNVYAPGQKIMGFAYDTGTLSNTNDVYIDL